MHPTVIFDIDGTLVDTSHRDHHLKNTPKDWAAFNAAMVHDTPRKDIVRLCQTMAYAGNYIALVTGREAVFEEATRTKMVQLRMPDYMLYMRPAGDYREDTIIKLELLQQLQADGYTPWLVVEDRSRLVRMWREQGLTCLQCAEGNF